MYKLHELLTEFNIPHDFYIINNDAYNESFVEYKINGIIAFKLVSDELGNVELYDYSIDKNHCRPFLDAHDGFEILHSFHRQLKYFNFI